MKKIETIWVIDDDEIHQLFAKKSIQHLEICNQILPFYDSIEAMANLKKLCAQNAALPDIIFLDINMPRMDGWEFMDELSKILPKISKKIIIFIVSSSIASIDKDRAQSYPAITDFLVKPASPKTIATLLREIESAN
jgi:CheY-like chemotaxis protein